jgi:D-3-phosphoglycerate dehydrogenase
MPRVLVADPISGEGIDILRAGEGVEVVVKDDIGADELKAEIGGFEAVIVRSRTKMTREVIEAGTRLKVIARGGVGLDNIDREAAEAAGVRVVNTPGASSASVAEHALALCFALARKIVRAHVTTASGKWEKKSLKGIELGGKTLGIIGLGRIGQELARRAAALGMRVIGSDPYVEPEQVEGLGIELVGIARVLQDADFVSLHIPLSLETKGMIGASEFDLMKPTAYLIDCARGGIVDEAALCDALRAGKIAGAALDVFENEPPEGSPLLGLENVVLTPHIAASTTDGQRRVSLDVARKVLEALGTEEEGSEG